MSKNEVWYDCKNKKPTKKGMYLLMVGSRNSYVGYTELGVIEAFWNGTEWGVNDTYALFKWRHYSSGEINRYPDFETNNRRRDLL